MRLIAKFEKGNSGRFVSHLDVQRLFQRAFRRADIPIAYSQGFNPHPQLSFATALTLGATSSAEWLDIKLEQDIDTCEFNARMNAALPSGFRIAESYMIEDKYPSLTAVMAAAGYDVVLRFEEPVSGEKIKQNIDKLLAAGIMVMKRTKAGMKETDIRPAVYSMSLTAIDGNTATFDILGRLDVGGGLSIDLLLGAYKEMTSDEFTYALHRKEIYSGDGKYLPGLDRHREQCDQV